MIKVKIFGLSASLLLLVTACGGGGGDGSSATNVSGTWRGALTKISDTCTPAGPAVINVTHQVSQNEDAVTLQSEAGIMFIGNSVGENGFSVDGNHATAGSNECNDQTRIAYDSINDNSDPTADIDITIDRTCAGSLACRLEYTGTTSRASNPAPGNPVPTIVSGITPITGGCASINPNPAAGTYGGDGGCGISDSAFSYQSNVVVLEPFGVNGVTSFNIDSANTSLATSQSLDLSIQGQSGYSCSMVCSPPGTFTVKCLKEGGVSCVEKF